MAMVLTAAAASICHHAFHFATLRCSCCPSCCHRDETNAHCRMLCLYKHSHACVSMHWNAFSIVCCRMALSDAKGDVDDRVRDLAASERELEKADFDLRYKTHEAKLVNKAAVAKRTEVGEVQLLIPKAVWLWKHRLNMQQCCCCLCLC